MSAIIDNRDENRFEQQVGEHKLYSDYRREGGTVWLTYVFAPPELRGTGAAGRFMQGLMEHLRAEGVTKLVPVCGYAAAWLDRHKEFAAMR